jgi:hypothetical protein
VAVRVQGNATGEDIATVAGGVLTPGSLQANVLAKANGEFYVPTTPADTQPVSAEDLPLPDGAATDAGLTAILAELQQKTEPGDAQLVSGPLTDAQLRAAPVPVSAKTALTASAPIAASVGTASAEVVPVNANRKGLVLVNTSEAWISIAFGAVAVLNSGISLAPGGAYTMTEHTFTTAQVRAIAGAPTSNLAIQEFV